MGDAGPQQVKGRCELRGAVVVEMAGIVWLESQCVAVMR